MKAVEPQRNTGGRFVMTADPAILKRIRGCPFARGGRVLVRFRANGYSLFARRSGEPLARLRLTATAMRSCCSTLRTAVAGARSATSAQAPCRSTKRSSASATIHISWTCTRPTVEPLQRIDAKQECCSLETTEVLPTCRPSAAVRIWPDSTERGGQMRIVQISDTHLSPNKPYLVDNWASLAAW